MEIITVASVKGGAGKSTSALSIAQVLAESDKKVLFVDLDPQGSSTQHATNPPEVLFDEDCTIREILKGEINIRQATFTPWENTAFIPADLRLQNIEKDVADENNPIFILHDALSEVEDDYDFALLDTSPNTGLLTRSALATADYIFIPVILESWPVLALDIVFQLIDGAKKSQRYINKGIRRVLLAPSFYEENRVVTRSFHYALKQGYTNYLSEYVIHRSADIAKTFSEPLSRLPSSTRAYQEYHDITAELIG
jgi:chromosome partitioning protein